MYLTSFTARNMKCFGELTLDFPSGEGGFAGWNVILGGNATGKTTLLQAFAVALVGQAPANRLASAASWVRRGAGHATLEARFLPGARDIAEGAPRREPYRATIAAVGEEPVVFGAEEYTAPQFVLVGRPQDREHRGLLKGPYAANKAGWLVCGYGSFRRFTGGAEDELTHEQGRVGRVASLFRESVALKRNLEWLPQLYARSLDPNTPERLRAATEYLQVRALLDQLLPSPVQIADVDTRRVYFSAPGTARVELLDLSDGYRSFLALALDLLRQMADVFDGVAPLVQKGPSGELWVEADGVVLIDEVDLHLHPTWQREIGPRLRQVFPRVQFVVSSHSPFIAQAASRDGLFVLRAASRDAPVGVIRPAPQVAGWTADEILTSPLFGLTDTRDPETERLLHEHAGLRGKAKFERLGAEDQRRLVAIERALSERLTAPGELRQDEVDDAVKIAAEQVRRLRGAEADPPPGH